MNLESVFNRLPARAIIRSDAPMKEYTTFRLGGSCRGMIDCPDGETLTATARLLAGAGLPYLVIGQGSNLLVSDEGLDCWVLRFCAGDAPEVEFEGCHVRVSGHTLLDDLARRCVERGVGDVTFCSGIPGTVGGAIAGNAGAFGRQIGDLVESVSLLQADGSQETAAGAELDFNYRSSRLRESGAIVLEAELKLKPADRDTMQKERERILELRRTKHPDWKTLPCAGSVFRNVEPTSAAERRQAAGWFLEEAGAKSFRVGGAKLFDRHANIIVTEPEATAADVFALSEKMVAAVRDHFGFELVREIKLLGNF